MDVNALIASIQEAVPDARLEPAASLDLQTTIYVSRDELPAVARVLRQGADSRFDFLAELTAVDFWPREPRFELVYVLVSIERRARLRLKVRLHGSDARVATVCDGHPDPRRLLMPEDWEGYPLRKDYPVQIKMAARTTEPLQVTETEFRENLEKDRLSRR
jgi:NADH-quinone oxidoreductase subunit C